MERAWCGWQWAFALLFWQKKIWGTFSAGYGVEGLTVLRSRLLGGKLVVVYIVTT
jgi:hypothetical protein